MSISETRRYSTTLSLYHLMSLLAQLALLVAPSHAALPPSKPNMEYLTNLGLNTFDYPDDDFSHILGATIDPSSINFHAYDVKISIFRLTFFIRQQTTLQANFSRSANFECKTSTKTKNPWMCRVVVLIEISTSLLTTTWRK